MMAEAAAVLGLISSIISLVDFGNQLVERINEFKEDYKERPKAFENIRNRLPLTIDSLERIKSQAEKGSLSDRTASAVKLVVDECLAQTKLLNEVIDKVLPSKNASGWERRWLALRSLTKDKDAQKSISILEAQIQNLTLYQTTNNSDYALKLLELQGLKIKDENKTYDHGLCLGNAPQLYDGAFVGRRIELDQLQEWLIPKDHRQRVVALSGLGGMGKTQLSIEFAQRSQGMYSSVFWLNAKTEVSLQEDMVSLCRRVVGFSPQSSNAEDTDEAISQLRQWLSRKDNWRWLVIFDNYDNPSLPGLQSEDGYDIRRFFPFSSQGSILITSRAKKLGLARPLELRKLEDVAESLAILKERSGREVEEDQEAKQLVLRLDGLPLALVTAATYVRQSSDSFGDYLSAYEKSWRDLEEFSDELLDYADRMLYSTWNLSFKQIEKDERTANLLRLLAYFDNQDVWFELFEIDDGPSWFRELASNKNQFRKCMKRLQDYSLVDAVAGSYSMHTCVHDWTLNVLCREPDATMYNLAVRCISKHVQLTDTRDYWIMNNRLLQHAVYVNNRCFQTLLNGLVPRDAFSLAYLCTSQGKMKEAEQMYQRALAGYEKAFGPDHISTPDTVNNLGLLYYGQGKMQEAEQMYQRALVGYEIVCGPENTSTLNTVNNLGLLYYDQGKMQEAEQMFQRALAGHEKVLGPEHTSTLATVNNLGNLYSDQGKLQEAEQMFRRALSGYEEALGPDHNSTLITVHNLGNLYIDQGKIQEAEQMLQRALSGREKVLGPDHTLTMTTVNNLGKIYSDQGKIQEAGQMFQRALAGQEKALGPDHIKTLITVNNMGEVLRDQGSIVEARKHFQRAALGLELALGGEHSWTRAATENLESLSSGFDSRP